MDITHTAIWITELEETKRYYTDVLGLNKEWETIDEDDVYNIYIKGDSETELQLKYDPEHERTIYPETIDHLAVETAMLESKFRTLQEEFNTTVVQEPITREARRGYTAKIALIKDPNGYAVELVEKIEDNSTP